MTINNCLLISCCLLLFASCAEQKEKPTIFLSDVVPVTITTVQYSSSKDSIIATGLVTTDQTTKYAFKIGGVIEKIYVDEGDQVRKGDLLAKLSLTEIESGYQQAQAAVNKAERDLARVKNLYQDSIATLENYQDAQTGLEIANQSLKRVAFDRDYAKIRAQSTGYVTKKLANKGEIIAPGSPFLITNDASSRRGWQLACSVNARQWAQIKKGDACTLYLDAYPQQKIEGVIADKDRNAEPVSGAFKVYIDLKSNGIEPAVGMYGKATLYPKTQSQTLKIPLEALVEANGKNGYVYLPQTDSTVIKRKIEISSYDKSGAIVKNGLKRGDRIILSNSPFLTASSKINIIN